MKAVKIVLGILISGLFMYLAFRKVDASQLMSAFRGIRWIYAVMITAVVLLSDWLRAVRWRYFLAPIKKVDTGSLFSALIIGYAANACLPAHLGELLRAYVIGRKRQLPASAAFATILTERVIDMFSLLALMLFCILIYPFPGWVRKSGWLMFFATAGLFLFIVLLKKKTDKTLGFVRTVMRPFPKKTGDRVEALLTTFLTGFVGLKRKSHYAAVALLSPVIWMCYVSAFWFGFQAFGFRLPWTAPFVLLVITTIGIVVPSSPGYIGTYHLLCQMGLGLYGVAKSPALAFAFVHHGLNIIPFFLLGLAFAWKEGVSLTRTETSIEGPTAP
jgi:glycosyltransferase 2 family protein